MTATSLGPGITEVIVFGGMFADKPIAETVILRFYGEGVKLLGIARSIEFITPKV